MQRYIPFFLRKYISPAAVGKPDGFTLPELMVVVIIIVLLTGAAVLNFRAGDESLAIERLASFINQDIRKTAALALKAEDYKECAGIEGFGIHFDKIQTPQCYLIYAECGGSATKYTGERCDGVAGGSDDQIAISLEFEDNVRIQNLRVNAAPVNELDIYFLPPDPHIWINSDDSSTTTGEIIIESTTGEIKTITVTTKGVVEVD